MDRTWQLGEARARIEEEAIGPSDEYAAGEETVADRLIALMTAHETALYRFLFVLTGEREAALDCTQDTFLRAYDNLNSGRQVNVGWLYTVARNLAMDRFRRARRQTAAVEQLQRLPMEGFPSPERGVVMRDAFAQLAPDDRTILYLFAVEGLSGREIADRLDISPIAVRMRIMRARERFRALYGGMP
jgi:RNA polymerase sigma-70 factor, ECF subfamily